MTPPGPKILKALAKFLALLAVVGGLPLVGTIGMVTYDCLALGMCPQELSEA